MKISKKFAFFVFLVILPTAAMLGPGRPAAAQQAGQSATDSKTTAKERRVIILGTTIVGSVAGPRVVYEVPWKQPEALRKKLEPPQRSFYEEIFRPLDKEPFEPDVEEAR